MNTLEADPHCIILHKAAFFMMGPIHSDSEIILNHTDIEFCKKKKQIDMELSILPFVRSKMVPCMWITLKWCSQMGLHVGCFVFCCLFQYG